MATVVRTEYLVGSRQGLTMLEQRFPLGDDPDAAPGVLLTAPSTGPVAAIETMDGD